MRWTKRLKWIRASKIIIPIALAISLVFAGFSVYAREAEFFVIRINNPDGVDLALTMNRDLSGQTPRLKVPVNGGYEDATWTPETSSKYNPKLFDTNLPNDIAKYDGEHSVYETYGRYSFFSFSFWLVNNSKHAVDVDMRMNIDGITVGGNTTDMHIDDAMRVMLIEGEPLLSENKFVIYKKAEKNEENEKLLHNVYDEDGKRIGGIDYRSDETNTIPFVSETCVFDRSGDLGYKNLAAGGTLRFTIVIWLEGWDVECVDPIIGESLKMSIDFTGN